MANSVATLTVTDFWYDGKRQHVIGAITLTNFNYITNGIPLSWTGQEFVKSATSPTHVDIDGLNGFMYSYDYTNNTLRIYKTGAALSGALLEEIGGAPLTANISSDTIKYHAIFKLI